MARSFISPSWPDPARPGAQRSVIAADLEIDGDVASGGAVEVHGRVRGGLSAPEIVVAIDGLVEGTVLTLDLSVLGSIAGKVEAKTLWLAASATVRADILHERLAIDAGARLVGRLSLAPGS